MAVMSNFGKVSVGVGKTLQVVDGQKYVTLQAEYDAYKISSQAAFDASMSELRESKDASIAAIQGDYDELNSQYSALSNQYDVLDASYQSMSTRYNSLNEFHQFYINFHTYQISGSDLVIPEGFIDLPQSYFPNGRNAGYYTTRQFESISFPSTIKIISYEFASGQTLKRVSFSEGLEQIKDRAFLNNAFSNYVSVIDIPSTVSYIGQWNFNNFASEMFERTGEIKKLMKVIVRNPVPPTIVYNSFYCSSNTNQMPIIRPQAPSYSTSDFPPYFYVPDESVDAYKAATNWCDYYSNFIFPMSEYTPS